ncbi:Dimerisation domain-containing protein [Microbispora rosea]|uniref:Dimerisation domain-containing protein n=1 Tax=Microbispora rosea TaxID=58117 RepID=A0A1N7H2Z7_9ACTN|nr:methyltransferase [Microbispora rosea]GIH44828.1 O-methyltransferase [Microbispora rosea subsp. rosea]SIS19212.1 Dimerisation domain-containing protein [Microbispora rosea]
MTNDSSQQLQADISCIKEIAWGLVSTAALVAAVDLGVAEALESGPRDHRDVARELGADPIALRQLLDALVTRGVFQRLDDGRYTHTGLSLLLRESDPNSVTYLVRWIGHPCFWTLWPHLTDAVRQGKAQSVAVLGKDFFRYIHEDDPAAVDVFNAAMTQASNHTSAEVVKALDLSQAQVVADIGGGQGHLIRTVLDRNPHLKGYLMDLEGVVARALPELRPSGEFADRVTLIGGDCRQEVPAQADVYLLKNILEWDDESTIRTLENVRRSARPGARVVVVETLTDHTPEPQVTTSLDLLLLLNVGGRKHSSEHVAELFARTGIRFDRVRPTGTFLSLAEGTVGA